MVKEGVAFEYSDEWIRSGFSINPFSLPLEKRLFIPEGSDFSGLFGTFDDSLPDGWGRLLTDRYQSVSFFSVSRSLMCMSCMRYIFAGIG